MSDSIMLENYVTYLCFLDGKFKKFFEKQKPFIFCKKGCGRCCRHAQFPYSQIEAEYLMLGVWQLDIETKKLITKNLEKIVEQKLAFKKEKDSDVFRYDCPFLINNECAVYNYRGIVCRSFGLMTVGANDKIKVPFCCFEGFNYSNVMEDNGKKVSQEKLKALGITDEPTAFNVSYDFLTDPDFERGFNFSFGEKKPLIEWLVNPKVFEELKELKQSET